MNKLLVICGPTAIGKTNLAVTLAQTFDAQLVSADSRQVYRGMDIVTGKDLPKESRIQSSELNIQYRGENYTLPAYDLGGVPIWMYDAVNPDEAFSVVHYQYLARAVIAHIQKTNKLPIVVGGTGLYIRSLLTPMETMSIQPDVALRRQLLVLSLEALQQRLQQQDPDAWKQLNPSDRQNPRRLIRKIEIAKAPGRNPELEYANSGICEAREDAYVIGLMAPLSKLYERIDQRVDERVTEGALDEIKRLQQKYPVDFPSMSGIGYRQKQTAAATMVQQWKYDEHAYARRQMTWFRKQPNIQWFDITKRDWQQMAAAVVTAWYTKP